MVHNNYEGQITTAPKIVHNDYWEVKALSVLVKVIDSNQQRLILAYGEELVPSHKIIALGASPTVGGLQCQGYHADLPQVAKFPPIRAKEPERGQM